MFSDVSIEDRENQDLPLGTGAPVSLLRAAIDHYKVIMNSIGDAIIRKSLGGVITGWSRGAETIFGYTQTEALGKSIRLILPHSQVIEEARLFARVQQGEEVKPFDTVRLRKDGSPIHVSVSISPILDDLGVITGISTIERDISDRVRMEQALIARERELRQLAEAVPQIIWVARPDGRITYLNERWIEFTGASFEESFGHGWNRLVHPADWDRARDGWKSAVKCGELYSIELRLRRADGVYHWWLVRGVPIVGVAGEIAKWHGTCTDVQDMKESEFNIERARRTMAESESQFRGAFEVAANGMALLSTEGAFLKVNDALCKMLCYAESELLQTRLQDITHLDDMEKDRDYINSLLKGAIKTFTMEKRYVKRDGGIIWLFVIISLVPDSTDMPIHFVAQIQDVSPRRAAEQTLREAGDFLEAAPDAMIAVNKDGKIIFANRQAVALFGYTKDELLGQPIELLIPGRLRHSHPRRLSDYFVAPRIRAIGAGLSLVASDRNGAEFPIEVSLSPVEILGKTLVVAAVRDITTRKQLEETLEATRARMVAASRLSALGEMAGGIAHEINNPVAVIHALASDLVEQEDASRSEIVEGGQLIVQYADRVANIVRSLRHVIRDGARDSFDEASVSSIVGQALNLCEERFRQHCVNLLALPVDPSIRLLCREVQISQIIINLLQNAFDATQDQYVEKWVRLEVVMQDDRMILSVIDSGNGVPSELKERIMDPFFTTKPVGKGTGLGLSLSRQIAEDHGGTLELNDLCCHTCFVLNLPAYISEAGPCN